VVDGTPVVLVVLVAAAVVVGADECEDELHAPRRSTSPMAAAVGVVHGERGRSFDWFGMGTPCQVGGP
jgi:uncharacterized protein YunC (DUF1805 family)